MPVKSTLPINSCGPEPIARKIPLQHLEAKPVTDGKRRSLDSHRLQELAAGAALLRLPRIAPSLASETIPASLACTLMLLALILPQYGSWLARAFLSLSSRDYDHVVKFAAWFPVVLPASMNCTN